MVPSRREQRRRAKDNGIAVGYVDTIIVDDIRCIVIAMFIENNFISVW